MITRARVLAFTFERDERRADVRDVSGVAVEPRDFAVVRRGDVDDCLGRLHRNHRLIGLHRVAGFHVPLHDFGFLQAFSEIRKLEDLHSRPF